MDSLLKRKEKIEIGKCLDFPSMDERGKEAENLKRENVQQHWQELKSRDAEIEKIRKRHLREFESVTKIGGIDRLSEKGLNYSAPEKDSTFAKIERGEK